MLLTSPKHDTWAMLTAVAAGAVAWQSIALMAGLLTVCTAMGLLAEWQARRTLTRLARAVPGGVITIRKDAWWGHAVWLVWGADSDQGRRQSRT